MSIRPGTDRDIFKRTLYTLRQNYEHLTWEEIELISRIANKYDPTSFIITKPKYQSTEWQNG